jgi:hypothetical protein
MNKSVVVAALVLVAASSAFAAPNQKIISQLQGAYAEAGPQTTERPYYQGTPTDKLDIWRRGRYLGNDPDSRIRHNLIRDDRGHAR